MPQRARRGGVIFNENPEADVKDHRYWTTLLLMAFLLVSTACAGSRRDVDLRPDSRRGTIVIPGVGVIGGTDGKEMEKRREKERKEAEKQWKKERKEAEKAQKKADKDRRKRARKNP